MSPEKGSLADIPFLSTFLWRSPVLLSSYIEEAILPEQLEV